MRRTTTVALVFVSIAGLSLAFLSGNTLNAEQANAAHTHIGHVMDGWGDTPDGQGLLPAAIAEATIAAQHAAFAAKDPSNLDAMKLHAAHVLHAVDPEQISNGPGLGYGVKKAAGGAAMHIEIAAKSDGASSAVMTHAEHVATSARNTVARVEQIVMLAQKISMASSASEASSLVAELADLSDQLISGTDGNGDGRIGWQEGEGGLDVSNTHATLMKTAEGLQ